MPVTKTCERCGKGFKVRADQAATRRFCSLNCSAANQRTKVSKACERCGETFIVKAYRAEEARYCGRRCYLEFVAAENATLVQHGLKKCRACKTILPLSAYYPHKLLVGGVNNNCKECDKQRKKREWQSNRERYAGNCKAYREANKEKVRASKNRSYAKRKDYYSEKAQRYYQANKTAILAQAEEYRRRNADHIKEQRKAYRLANAEAIKALLKKYRGLRRSRGSFTVEQWRAKCEYWGGRCYLCGVDLAGLVIHCEHRIPLSRGGLNIIANIAPACQHCNLSKNNKTEAEFRAWRAEHEGDRMPAHEKQTPSNCADEHLAPVCRVRVPSTAPASV